MSLTSYQAAPPRVFFEEKDNALSPDTTQPFLKKIFRLKASFMTGQERAKSELKFNI
jgi:hypothetical protein